MRCPQAVIAAALVSVLGAACASQPGPAAPPDSPSPSVGRAPTVEPGSDATAPEGAVAGVPVGFDRVAARVTAADGAVCDLCLWLADTAPRRARGLRSVTDLGAADGMAFRYPEPHTTNFWMKDTLLPLSIAFFDADGAYVSAFDMEPCAADPCPRYATADGFTIAVEVPQGALADLDIGPGSTLELTDLPCAAGG